MLEGFADFVIPSDSEMSLDAFGPSAGFPRQYFSKLNSSVYYTFPEENEMKAESAKKYLNLIVKMAYNRRTELR